MKKLIFFICKIYKTFLSENLERVFGGGCRYTPTCSQYFLQSIEKKGLLQGSFLGFKRILSCHPFGKFGFDPVG